MNKRAFISHSTSDDSYIAELESFLRASGFEEVFNDVNSIHPDENLWPVICQGIEKCDVFYVVITTASSGSGWVKREIDYARGILKKVVPVWIEDCPMPATFEGHDVIDFRPGSRQKPKIWHVPWQAIVGSGCLVATVVTLCLVDPPGLMLGKCLRLLLAVGVAMLAMSRPGRSAQLTAAGLFLLLALFYDPLDARPFLAQIGLITPNPAVATLQDYLAKESGYETKQQGIADGSFVAHVAELQATRGLPVTGVVDGKLIAQMEKIGPGTVVSYQSNLAIINTDGPGGSTSEDPVWQSSTSLKDTAGNSINSRIVPLVTVPSDHANKGIQLGDMALVHSKTSGKQAYALIGDLGPRSKSGAPRIEISPALAQMLGLPKFSPTIAIQADLSVFVFVGSAPTPKIANTDDIQAKGKDVMHQSPEATKIINLLK